MNYNTFDHDLRFSGSCLLVVIAVYVLVGNAWGYAFFADFLHNLEIFRELTYPMLGTPIGVSIGYNVLFALVINSIIVALFTAILTTSSYSIISKIKTIGSKVSFSLYTAIICAVVFLIATILIYRRTNLKSRIKHSS